MVKKTNGHMPRGRLKLYRSYNFVDKDPVIDRIRTIFQKEHVDNKDAASISGVSQTTLFNWFDGKTKRPQYATIAAVTLALGYTQEFVKSRRVDIGKEVEKAKAELEAAKQKLQGQ